MDTFTLKEFHKRYLNSCVGLRLLQTGEVKSVQISSINSMTSSEAPKIVVNGWWGKKIDVKNSIIGDLNTTNKTFNIRDVEVLPIPNRQVFDFGGRTIVFSRSPQRQWTKGVTSSNSLFTDPIRDLTLALPKHSSIKINMISNVGANIRYLNNLFVENHASNIEEAIGQIKKYGLASRSLDSAYFLALSINNKFPYILFRYSLPVAYYDDVSDTFEVTNPIFIQEISDFCRRHFYNSNIKESDYGTA